jgi:3-oxoadipate enol-lactonase/4-carboxymuconolactone decarboxylase
MTAVPTVAGVQLTPPGPGKPLLVVGHSLGTSSESLWGAAASALARDFHVVGWDAPGHGRSPAPEQAFTVAELATAVLAVVDAVQAERGEEGAAFAYAGDSIGGAVGLSLLLDHADRVSSATLLCTGARLGTTQGWHERAELVRRNGTPVMVERSAATWFGPGFLEQQPEAATGLLLALQQTDRDSYAHACEALADFDVRSRLAEITAPVLAVCGRHDQTATLEIMREVAETVRRGRLVVLDDVAHQAPVEAPALVATLLRGHSGRADGADGADGADEVQAAGLAVRRAVLGDAWVDRAAAGSTDFTRDFQDLITRYAWGSIWTRPGLDRRSRSLITLTALVARGHHEELALHVRAALTNGLSVEEIKETLLQTAVYCGVPDANTAFRIAQGVLDEITEEKEQP